MARKHTRGRGKRMLGGYSTLVGVPINGGTTSGQQFGAQAVMKGGSNNLMKPTGQFGGSNNLMPNQMGQTGGAYQMIVPAALVLANNVIGRGRSLRYKGKGGLARGNSSSYSRRRKGSRRR